MIVQAAYRASKAIRDLQAINLEMVHELRGCDPAASSLGAHLLSLKDPKTGQLLDDYQLEAELSTFFAAGAFFSHSLNSYPSRHLSFQQLLHCAY